MIEKIINWSELSRYIAGGNRGTIRQNLLPEKHIKELDKLFTQDLPRWWEDYKKQNGHV